MIVTFRTEYPEKVVIDSKTSSSPTGSESPLREAILQHVWQVFWEKTAVNLEQEKESIVILVHIDACNIRELKKTQKSFLKEKQAFFCNARKVHIELILIDTRNFYNKPVSRDPI